MNVELLSYTKDADRLCGAIARSCYSSDDAGELMGGDKTYWDTLKGVIKSGHHSVIEHAVFTFNIAGISRVTSHQLVRHRVASYTQQSQRYVRADVIDTVIPESIKTVGGGKLIDTLEETVYEIAEKLRTVGVPEEDIRYLYPNGMRTNIVVTMNARSLLNFFSLRCCDRSQWEIRELANRMLALCKGVAPIIFENAGAPCTRGVCPEGTRGCGKHD